MRLTFENPLSVKVRHLLDELVILQR